MNCENILKKEGKKNTLAHIYQTYESRNAVSNTIKGRLNVPQETLKLESVKMKQRKRLTNRRFVSLLHLVYLVTYHLKLFTCRYVLSSRCICTDLHFCNEMQRNTN